MNIIERFKAKVQVQDMGAETPCWVWTGQKRGSHGHGGFWMGGRMVLAHRAAYELFIGELEDSQVIRHTCDTTGCTNPDHLLPGTQAENVQDMIQRGRAVWQRSLL